MTKSCVAALALIFAAPALAQQVPPPASEQAIIVEATRDRDRQVRDFVQALTPGVAPYNGQVSRFEWSVCPVVFGLPKSQGDAIRARIRQVGEAVGVKMAKEPCPGNALVIVADDKRETLAWMERHLTGYFYNSAGRLIHIPRERGPAVSWHVGDLLNADGTPASVDLFTGRYIVKSDNVSHFRPGSQPHFLASVLIVEARSLAGLTTTEFGDYAAMRTFAQVNPNKLQGQAAPTILNILEAPMDTPLPLTLTQWDFSFLRGLYAATPYQYATTQRHQIARSMRSELSTPQQ